MEVSAPVPSWLSLVMELTRAYNVTTNTFLIHNSCAH